MGKRLASVAACLAVLAQGCAIVTTKGAPDTLSPHQPPDCTTSRAAVYADGGIATAAVATSLFLGIAALGKQASLDDGETNKLAYATLYTFLGGFAFSISGLVGKIKVNSCRRATETWRMRQANPPSGYPAPGPYAPQPYPPQPYPPQPYPPQPYPPAPAPAPAPTGTP